MSDLIITAMSKVEYEVLPALIIDVAKIAGVPVFEFEVFIHCSVSLIFITRYNSHIEYPHQHLASRSR